MVSRLEQLCVKHGLRMSEQRRAILRVIDQAADHPSAEEIYKRALQNDARLSIATVYRTMTTLAEAGILSRIEFGDGRARYEDDHGEHHEHLVDVDNGRVIELKDPALEVLLRQIAERSGYRLVDYRLEAFGKASRHPCSGVPALLYGPRGKVGYAQPACRQFELTLSEGMRSVENDFLKKAPALFARRQRPPGCSVALFAK